jgi:holo-[acyl-carrier protein] synthase
MEQMTSPLETINGIGTDIIEVRRIKEAVDRHGERFINRIFTKKEQLYCQCYQDPIPRYAGRFAAKEAILKAIGTGIGAEISWKDIEIVNDPHGKPEAYFSSRLKKAFPLTHLFVSISHCEEYATATAILVGVFHGAS